MKNLILTLVAAFALTACSQTVNIVHLQRAVYVCKGGDNISTLRVYARSEVVVTCLNGEKYHVNDEDFKVKNETQTKEGTTA